MDETIIHCEEYNQDDSICLPSSYKFKFLKQDKKSPCKNLSLRYPTGSTNLVEKVDSENFSVTQSTNLDKGQVMNSIERPNQKLRMGPRLPGFTKKDSLNSKGISNSSKFCVKIEVRDLEHGLPGDEDDQVPLDSNRSGSVSIMFKQSIRDSLQVGESNGSCFREGETDYNKLEDELMGYEVDLNLKMNRPNQNGTMDSRFKEWATNKSDSMNNKVSIKIGSESPLRSRNSSQKKRGGNRVGAIYKNSDLVKLSKNGECDQLECLEELDDDLSSSSSYFTEHGGTNL